MLATNQKNIDEYRAGKDKAFNALVGQVMKASQGKANPAQVNALLKARLRLSGIGAEPAGRSAAAAVPRRRRPQRRGLAALRPQRLAAARAPRRSAR